MIANNSASVLRGGASDSNGPSGLQRSTSSASTNPLDALVLACEHHEGTASSDEEPAQNTSMVVPSQPTPASTIRTVSVESTKHTTKTNKSTKAKAKSKKKPSPAKKKKASAKKKKVSKSSSRPTTMISPIPSVPTTSFPINVNVISSAIIDVPSASTREFAITNNDVLCGRGGLTNHHPGNILFRNLVKAKQPAYVRATKREKSGVSVDIVSIIRRLTPPGRFLKRDAENPEKWVDIGDQKAREKTSQALREGAPAVREELTALARKTKASSVQPGLLVPPFNQPINPSVFATAQQANSLAFQGSDKRTHLVSSDSDSSLPPLITAANIVTPTTLTTTISSTSRATSTAEGLDLSSTVTTIGRGRSKLPRTKLLKARMGEVSD